MTEWKPKQHYEAIVGYIVFMWMGFGLANSGWLRWLFMYIATVWLFICIVYWYRKRNDSPSA